MASRFGIHVSWEVILTTFLIVASIIVLSMYFAKRNKKTTETLVNIISPEPSHTMEGKQDDIITKPTILDAGSGSVMSGQEFVPSQFMSPWYQAYTGDLKNHYLLDDGAGGSAGLQFNMCSKSCCSEQYPLPFKMPVETAVCENASEFVPNNYMCNNAWQDSGCVCMTKDQANFLGSRGGNA